MYWHPHDRIAYLAPPRTASRAIRDWLMTQGWVSIGPHHDTYIPDEARFVLVSVRDHWSALVSWWRYLEGEPESFSDWLPWFLDGQGGAPPLLKVGAGEKTERPDSLWCRWLDAVPPGVPRGLIRHEQLADDLEYHLKREPKLHHVGDDYDKRQGRSLAEVMTPADAEVIATVYTDEIALLGYRAANPHRGRAA